MIRIGSRESVLAVIQSELIIEQIKKVLPEETVELITMKTTGDRILDKSLEQIGGKGLFVKELDRALLDRECDLTVHSLKDMPMEVAEELPILAFSVREDKRDVLVLRKGLDRLPEYPVIGTFSKRRRLQAEKIYPDATFKGIRGNLVTRLKKLDDGEYDGLILAAAGLLRMGFEERIHRYFTTQEIIPSAGQGIMAVQGRFEEDFAYLKQVNSKESQVMALAERAFVRTLDGGCTSPTAATADLLEGGLCLRGLYYDEKTDGYVTGELTGPQEEAEQLGIRLAISLREIYQKERKAGSSGRMEEKGGRNG